MPLSRKLHGRCFECSAANPVTQQVKPRCFGSSTFAFHRYTHLFGVFKSSPIVLPSSMPLSRKLHGRRFVCSAANPVTQQVKPRCFGSSAFAFHRCTHLFGIFKSSPIVLPSSMALSRKLHGRCFECSAANPVTQPRSFGGFTSSCPAWMRPFREKCTWRISLHVCRGVRPLAHY